jgi:hypothetical protein
VIASLGLTLDRNHGLFGSAAAGLDDIHTHPALPRTARLVLRIQF